MLHDLIWQFENRKEKTCKEEKKTASFKGCRKRHNCRCFPVDFAKLELRTICSKRKFSVEF